jgi:hypothetical protein
MADCDLLQSCIFFNDKMANMPSTAEVFKIKYCRGDSVACARHLVFRSLGAGRVPSDLFPNQMEAAVKVVTAALQHPF